MFEVDGSCYKTPKCVDYIQKLHLSVALSYYAGSDAVLYKGTYNNYSWHQTQLTDKIILCH